jgi:hypothetical protein
MSLPIISADQRLAERRGVKGCIFGKSGIGKTSLLWTLNPATTLFMDLEAGDLAIEGWAGDTIRPRTWQECRDFAVFIGGSNPALRDGQAYSPAHFAAVCERFDDPNALDRYETLFIDSITVAGRLCFQWCKGQPYRAFICQTLNSWGYPAKDRSGRLDPVEEPHLGRLMDKIRGPAKPATERMEFVRPAELPAGTPDQSNS